jgi:single-strand DNA-binding protein
MAYELEGSIKEVYETKTFAKGFTKREFVVTTSTGPEDRYPQHVKLGVVKDKCSLLDRFRAGQKVKVSFDIRGSEYQGKYFTDLQAWRVEEVAGGSQADASPEDDYTNFDEPSPGHGSGSGAGAGSMDDIPF